MKDKVRALIQPFQPEKIHWSDKPILMRYLSNHFESKEMRKVYKIVKEILLEYGEHHVF